MTVKKTLFGIQLSLVLLFLLTGNHGSILYAANLGIGVKPIPKVMPDDNAKLTENSNLWFIVDDGQSLSREVILRGGSVDQKVNLEIIGASEINGELSPSNEVSEVAKFTFFSDNNFVLRANENRVIQVRIAIPKGTPSQSFNSYLSVTVGAKSINVLDKKKSNAKIQAIVKNQIRTLLRMFVGIGSYKDFYTDLQIEDVKDYSISGAKFLDVVIKNTGKTPITPSGEVSFSSLDFAGLRFGPVSYLTLTMEPGRTSKFKMRVPEEIEPGKWQILVKAQQGNIVKTRIFEKNLKFREGVNWLNLITRTISAILALALFYYLRRTYSLTKRQNDSESLAKSKRISRQFKNILTRFKIHSRKKGEVNQGEVFDVEKFLEELRSTTKKATTKKATTKKATTKKATTKKATTKKATK